MSGKTRQTGRPERLEDADLDPVRGGIWLQDWISNANDGPQPGDASSVNLGGGWDPTSVRRDTTGADDD